MPIYDFIRNVNLLSVDSVSVSYDKPILKDVSFRIDNIHRPGFSQGQVVAILGPSGVGKTQLFRCIAGLQKPNSGKIIISDPPCNDGKQHAYPVEAGQVGVVLQNYPLLQHRTVMGNLNLVAKTAEEKQRAITLLERLKLADKQKSYPCELSGGQRQRVAIIQQLLCSSTFMLMDEPFSGLDPLAKVAMCNLISEINRMDEYNTIILSTHDLECAMMTADTILLLGRDHDEKGAIIPGAYVKKSFDLLERGLAWRPDIETQPGYIETFRELKAAFWDL